MDTATDPAVEGPAETSAPAPRRRRRVLLWTLLAVAVVLIAVVAAGLWIGSRALAAKDSLERAESLVGDLRDSLTADPAAAPALADQLVDETRAARDDTDGVVWRIGEAVPVLGKNLAVVRGLAASVDEVARNAVLPLAEAGTQLGALKPVDGALDMDVIRQLAGSVASADAALTKARDQVEALDASGTIGQVADAHARLSALLGDAADTAAPAADAASLLVPMLGGDGPRNYLLMFQNPAEAVPLGGNPASVLLVGVDQGRISIAGQAASGDFRAGSPIPVDPALTDLYYRPFADLIQDIGTRPDFPTMAELGKAYWERDVGGTVDGVISFDPVALGELLAATGPLPLPSGDVLTQDNAVELLLYEVYARYPDPRDQDVFFGQAAVAIFQSLTTGAADPAALIQALAGAVDEGRFMMWSAHADEQDVIAASALSGILPTDNSDSTTVGVYFDDYSGSKLDYFLDTSVRASVNSCAAAEDRVVTVTYSLSNRITQGLADQLPEYVAGVNVPRGDVHTEIYVVGPPGSTFLDWSVDSPGVYDELVKSGSDLGRPVVRLGSYLNAQGVASVTVRFAAPTGDLGPLEVRTTPMVNPTEVSVDGPSCG